jgi:hypothetical protein
MCMLAEGEVCMVLLDGPVPVRLKLAGMWASVMCCYGYGDYFELYQPGKLQGMLGGLSQGALMGISAAMLPACLMVCLSLLLPAAVCRWMNVVFGALYTVIMVLVVRGGWHFYVMYGVVEMALTMGIVWVAWSWPRDPA